MKEKKFSNLFWKISAVFFVMLAVIACVYGYLTINYSGMFFDEVNQKLNKNAAADIVKHSTPFINGSVNDKGMKETFNSVMSISPALEVYLLDTNGGILSFYAPEKKIVRNHISLDPIKQYLSAEGSIYITGDDPRHEGQQKIFSVAPIVSGNNKIQGYIYVILSGDQYAATSGALRTHYVFRLGLYAMLITLIATLFLGLFFIRIITRNFSRILEVMKRFREGDLQARIDDSTSGDVRQLSEIFNEMADILTDNIEQLKQVEILRRELIANVSHDLRTPVAIIHGYAETLQMKSATLNENERKAYLDTVMESTINLEKLITELFELSQLEANQVQPNMEPFDISELANDMSNKYKLIGATKQINIQTSLSRNLPPVYADIALIERVIQNLVDNALKFTPAGGEIVIRTEKEVGFIAVSIIDNGIGIDDHEQGKIFDRYYKSKSRSDFKSGVGLGLAIVRKILELHHSDLHLISQKDKGSTFTFRLPLYKTT